LLAARATPPQVTPPLPCVMRQHCVSAEAAASMTTTELKELWTRIYGRESSTANKAYLQRAVTFPGLTHTRARSKKKVAAPSPSVAPMEEAAAFEEEEDETSQSEGGDDPDLARWKDVEQSSGTSEEEEKSEEEEDEEEEEEEEDDEKEQEENVDVGVEEEHKEDDRLEEQKVVTVDGARREFTKRSHNATPLLPVTKRCPEVVEVLSSDEGSSGADETELQAAVERWKRRRERRAAKRLRALMHS
jgi:hypothetical protein